MRQFYGVCWLLFQKWAELTNGRTRKKVNDSASPFLITFKHIKINLNKRHRTGKLAPHIHPKNKDEMRCYHEILFNS